MIVRDGWPFILVGLVLTVILLLGSLKWDSMWLLVVTAVFALLTLLITFFFRDPEREIPDVSLALVAPADGRVVAIDSLAHHPYLDSPATRVSIFLSIFDVHVNRMPVTGTVDYIEYRPGKFLAAFKNDASEVNEQTEIGMRSEYGEKLVIKQIAGVIARRIVCRVEKGDRVSRGDRFGMIRFGSRTDLIVPAETDIHVQKGDHVKGAASIIGTLPDRGPSLPSTEEREGNDARL